MTRSEKIKFIESVINGEFDVPKNTMKFIWITDSGITFSFEKLSPQYGMKITKETFLRINGQEDIVFLCTKETDLPLQGSVKRFVM